MLSWEEFEKSAPAMAKFGAERLAHRVMYLGTVRRDGYPRVHPISPFLSSGHLFAFMEPTSPKGHDLTRDGRFAMHSLVRDWNGSDGEFSLAGRAHLVTDPALLDTAIRGCPYAPQSHYVCFEFMVEECMTNTYVEGEPNTKIWRESRPSSS